MYRPKRAVSHHRDLPFTILAVFLTLFGIGGWTFNFINQFEDFAQLPVYNHDQIIKVSDAQAHAAIDKRKAELAPNANLVQQLTKIDESGNSSLTEPLKGPITSPFGYRSDPIAGSAGFHTGMDIGVPCGTVVRAAGPGEVVAVGFQSVAGNRIRIRHSNTLESFYGHLSAFKVKVGDKVATGDVIALSGTTGYSTGCHLHFQVEYKGKPVNPLNYLKK